MFLDLLLGQNIAYILSSQNTSMADTCFFGPPPLTKGFVRLPNHTVFLYQQGVLVGDYFHTLS